MIITNPYRHHPTTHEESHLLKDDFGLIGVEIDDCITPTRRWVIQGLYCPIEGRALGGIRAKVVDDFGFISFVNQRDLEVLLLYAQPGQHCIWAGEDYPAPGDRNWYGLAADYDDLLDDLYDRELGLRMGSVDFSLPDGIELERRIHLGDDLDFEELWWLQYDCDPETGQRPDLRRSTIDCRWRRIGRSKLTWRHL